ncbi:MAG TPA: VWA domain-containing protein [Pyrinomonadaceae bacterium]|nr:VWA domain-containing protein [Pyrinomonadaceae bacterium]
MPPCAQLTINTSTLIVTLLLSTLILPCAPLQTSRAQDNAPPQTIQQPTQTPTPADGEEVERIDTDLATILLSATDKKRRFVTTLKAEDVRVLEDGVEQRIASFERETDAPLSLALLVDTSASQEKVLRDEQTAAIAFVRSVLRPQTDSASVLSFTGITRLDQPPTSDATLLLAAVEKLKVEYTQANPVCDPDNDVPDDERLRCRTGVFDSIVVAVREVLSKTSERTRRAIILLSDGDDTSSRTRIYQAVEHAVRHNTVVYSIGIRDRHFKEGEMRRDYLRRLAEETGGRAFFPKDARDLSEVFAQIERELRSQYLITYTPLNRARDGSFRKLQIEITTPALRKEKLRLLYRQGYYARQTQKSER